MTIKDLARICGVSVSTVSRVLNERPDVSDDVRERVMRAITESGYIPNSAARDLVSRGSDAVGVVVRGPGNLFFAEMLKTVSREIEKAGLTMVLHYIDADADEVKAGAILEREKKLKGLVFLGGRFDYTPAELSLVNVPYVCCSFTNRFGSLNSADYSSVSIDDRQTAYRAVAHLISLGHRRIAALIPGASDSSISELRYEGYCRALRDNGIPLDDSLVEETGSFRLQESYDGMVRLLNRTDDFTGLFAVSDTIGMAAIKALQDRGRRVPEDVSVIGIDGLSVSAFITPTLTTLVQPGDELGREAVAVLLDMIEHRESRHVVLSPTLREGRSVRKL